MNKYKDLITCWLNKSKKDDGLFLSINDIQNDKTTFVKMHKFWVEAIREAQEKGVTFPKVPMFKKSVKIEENADIAQDAMEALADDSKSDSGTPF